MRIGICGGLDKMEAAARSGFEYLEMSVAQVAGLSEADYAALRQAHDTAPLPTPSFNCLFPGGISLLSPATRDEDITAYLKPALGRVAELGGQTVVFGSGAARRRPDSLPFDAAWRRLTEVTRLIGETAAAYGITIVIEPLNRGETNLVNSVAEGACLRASVNHPNVQLLADFYHIAREGHAPEDLSRVGGIAHAHIAALEGRRVPVREEPGFREMLHAMKETGYTGDLSVEGGTDDLYRDGPEAVRLLKRLWEET